jgi:hypothetical protein
MGVLRRPLLRVKKWYCFPDPEKSGGSKWKEGIQFLYISTLTSSGSTSKTLYSRERVDDLQMRSSRNAFGGTGLCLHIEESL